MRFLARHMISGLMLMVIALTSVELAAARGQAPAVGTMVICTGTGPLHILVDENGQPTGGVMVCPDYALAFYADVDSTPPDALRTDLWHALWVSRTDARAVGAIIPVPQARGPPVAV